MKTNLGKVAITPKGTWDSTTVYTALDTVNFGGGSWLAKRGNIAVTPTEGDDWMQLSAKGADAELTKDGIVSALGYTPERDYGNYELIESITLTESTIVKRTTTPDGRAYNFRDVVVKAARGDTAQSATGWRFDSSGGMCGYVYYSVTASYPKIAVRCYAQSGYWWSVRYAAGGDTDYGSTFYGGDSYMWARRVKDFPTVNSIYSVTAIAAGTTLKIFAIWA